MEALKVWIVSLLEKKSIALLFEGWGWGLGGSWTSRPEIRGNQVSKRHFFQPVWSLTIRRGPGSATFFITGWSMYMYLYDSMSNGKGLGWSTPSLGSFWQMLKKGANHAQHQFLKTTNQNLLKQCSLWSGKLLSSPKILETGTWLLIAPSLRTADVSSRSSLLRDVSRRGTSATQRQKFHTDDAKSVRNPVRSANWSTEKFHCFSYCLRMTDKRPQRSNVNAMNL